MIVKSEFIKLLKPGLKEDYLDALGYSNYVIAKGYFLDITNEEGEPIFSEDEPWWMI